jgi:ParB-like nuclease domain
VSEIVEVPIDSLTEHPDNARSGDVPKIMRSLERFGLVKPVIVQRSTGYIVAGNHVTKAAKRLGWTTIKCVVQDMDDETARAYLIADNATSDGSTYDKGKLLGVLQSALSLDGMGFDEDDIESLNEEVHGKKEDTGRRASTPAIEIDDREADGAGEAEPMREIPLRMTAAAIQEFSRLVLDLQQAWGAHTLIEVVGRAVRETHERWRASESVTGKAGSADALPELAGTDF